MSHTWPPMLTSVASQGGQEESAKSTRRCDAHEQLFIPRLCGDCLQSWLEQPVRRDVPSSSPCVPTTMVP